MCRVLLALLLWALPLAASSQTGPVEHVPAEEHSVLEVFVREGCPHCVEAEDFLSQLALDRPELRIVYRAVDRDAAARERLLDLSRRAGIWPPGVPTFAIGGRLLVGFDDAERSGPAVLALLREAPAPADRVRTTLFGTLSAARLGLPLFTLALGLLDGFNPCATWVLLFLLSLLVRLHNRRRMAIVAGTFVLVSGAVYYAFMAAWLNVFLIVGLSKPLRWGLAGVALAIGVINVKDFVAWGRGLSLSIPAKAKPGLYARLRTVLSAEALPASLLAVGALAVVVNFVELLCTAGLPAIYTAVLTQHHLSVPAHYAYIGLYILAYIADDSLMVAAAVIALTSFKPSVRIGSWLKLLSGAVMLVLGLLMILRFDWLT